MQTQPFTYRMRVRFVDTDASGRIHYTAMFRYFEAAEQEFMRAIGFSYAATASQNTGYPRVHAECDYLAEVSHDDPLAIEVTVERVGKTSFTLAFSAVLEDRTAAKGKITVVAMDKTAKKARRLTAELAEALAKANPSQHSLLG